MLFYISDEMENKREKEFIEEYNQEESNDCSCKSHLFFVMSCRVIGVECKVMQCLLNGMTFGLNYTIKDGSNCGEKYSSE